jgi:nucleotide-binding universal stress UspA family protein
MKTREIKKILIPVDFTEYGEVALDEAAKLANLAKAEIFLIHVIESNPFMAIPVRESHLMFPTDADIEKYVQESMNILSKSFKKSSGITPHINITTGRVYSEIIRFSEENQIDLIMMGTHGASGYKEVFIGSNAQRVVTISEIPVLTIQHKKAVSGFRNILIPIDNALHSREKVNIAMLISNLFGAKIHLIGLLQSDDKQESNSIKIKLESVEKLIEADNLPFHTTLVHGTNLAQEAMSYAEKENCDLIVINTGHESKITGVFLGAFAQQIVNHSAVAVLSFRHAAGHYYITTPGYGIE